ncbi:hypothetical protein [Streptomyces sp. NPDC048643]|uniref:hypothetical protein n=1 Tax=Streptomyces sp. NPDC048643 TaxID=3155637 RepID=UPI003418CF05
MDVRETGVCRACGSRPAIPSTSGPMLCEHCSKVLEIPDSAGLVVDDGAGVRREFENRGKQQNH